MLWEHFQNKDFYLFSGAQTRTKLLPLASVQKRLEWVREASNLSLDSRRVVLHWSAFKENTQIATHRVEPQCEDLTTPTQAQFTRSDQLPCRATAKVLPPFPQWRWLIEDFWTLNQTTQVQSFSRRITSNFVSDLKAADGRTDGRIEECRLWDKELETAGNTRWASGQQPTALCCVWHANPDVPAWSHFFVSQLCWRPFFPWAKDNAGVIATPWGTRTKHSIITEVLPSVKVHAVRRGTKKQVAHQWKGSLMWLRLASVPMITNGGVRAVLITHSAAQRNAAVDVPMQAHLRTESC